MVACALALVQAREATTGALLVDLAGDAPAVAGIADDPAQRGVTEWLAEGGLVPSDGLARLEVPLGHGLSLLPRGHAEPAPARAHALVSLLTGDPRPVVIDAGVVTPKSLGAIVAARAPESLLVIRPCFLAIRRAFGAPVRPTAIVLVVEEGRSITARDVESVFGVPVRAEVQVTAAVARAVDSGTLTTRLPRSLERDIRAAA